MKNLSLFFLLLIFNFFVSFLHVILFFSPQSDENIFCSHPPNEKKEVYILVKNNFLLFSQFLCTGENCVFPFFIFIFLFHPHTPLHFSHQISKEFSYFFFCFCTRQIFECVGFFDSVGGNSYFHFKGNSLCRKSVWKTFFCFLSFFNFSNMDSVYDTRIKKHDDYSCCFYNL